MKSSEKNKAIALRRQGVALGQIARTLGVSKASVSVWVREIVMTSEQQQTLLSNSHSRVAIEKRRQSRMDRHKTERAEVADEAWQEAHKLIHNPLWVTAVALYWGEGGKTQRTTRIANSDPAVISLMARFFKQVCGVPVAKMRGHVHAFAGSEILAIEEYWAKVSGIPRQQFFKSYLKNSVAGLGKRRTLPNGTFQMYVHDTKLFLKMMAWIEYLKEQKN